MVGMGWDHTPKTFTTTRASAVLIIDCFRKAIYHILTSGAQINLSHINASLAWDYLITNPDKWSFPTWKPA